MTAALKNLELAEASDSAYRTISSSPGILVADDMGLILKLLKLELEPRGFTVWLAMDGDDALDLFRRNREAIDLVLLDVQMPGLDGPNTLAALRRLDPDVFACFMTGGSGTYTEEDLLEHGAVCIFNKPFRASEVAHFLQKLVEHADFTNLSALFCGGQRISDGGESAAP